MKKISLGSFPLIDVKGKDRRIFESYLIKVISDLITSNQITNTIYSDRVQYITPLSIMKFIKEDSKDFGKSNFVPGSKDQESIRSAKADTIKHAFKNTKNLYQSIASDPFYRNNMFYPIYIEEAIKTNQGYNDYNYDFLILANDLMKQQLVDEITFDDNATLLFLVLKCLLMPDLKVNEIGTEQHGGNNFRKYFALFLETCKNENVNPFDMFIKLIKAAGKQKRNNIPGAMARLTNRVIGRTNVMQDTGKLYHSKSFVNLFNTEGEIKDASFLLNEPIKNINKFLSDDGEPLKNDYNPILRQYSQAKTHEYGKILSVVDALGAFNKSNNVLTELNSNTILSHIPIDQEESLTINKETITSELETIYFRRFLEDLVKLQARAINAVRNDLLSKFKQDLTNNNIVTKETLTKDIAVTQDKFTKVSQELKTWQDKAQRFTNALGLTNFEDIPGARPDLLTNPAYVNTNNAITNYQNQMALLTQELSIQNAKHLTAPTEQGIKDTIDKDRSLSMQVNLEIFQSQLTAVYSEIYQYIFSKTFEDHIVSLKATGKITDTNINSVVLNGSIASADLKSMIISIAEISDMFQQEIEINIKDEIAQSFMDPKRVLQTNIKSTLGNVINDKTITDAIVKNIFIPIFTKYTNRSISNSNQIKDIKSENNPVLKRILSSKDLFKSYLLTSDTLVAAYELLHYIDTIKYEEGIINHPVSKLANPINKMDFMIKRLGLSENPVFIFNHNDIILSMPAHLSLTGQNFINQIKMEEFMQFGQINWSRDLWDQNLMFGGPTNSNAYKDLNKSISKIKDEITELGNVIKTADAKVKIKKQAELARKQNELAAKQTRLEEIRKQANGSTFTSNMQKDKRTENNSNYQMQLPQSGRYNDTMDSRGYDQNERNIIDQSRNNMDYLRNQTTQNYPENNYRPPHQQDYYPQGNPNIDNIQNIHQFEPQERNNFMNNPYIQNRANQLNNPNQLNQFQN